LNPDKAKRFFSKAGPTSFYLIPILFAGTFLLMTPADAGSAETPVVQPRDPLLEGSSLEAAPGPISGEVLVKFRPEFWALRGAVHAEIGGELLSSIPEIHVERVRGRRGQTASELIKAYADRPEVEYAEVNGVVRPQAAPNDPLFPMAWDLNNVEQSGGARDADIDAVEAWDLVTGGEVVVAVLDSGVDYRHPDLADNIWTNPGEIPGNGVDDEGNGFVDDLHGWNFVDGNNDPMDLRYHGTHVAGIIAAVGNNGVGIAGINWKSKIMPVKFFKTNSEGSFEGAARAILYASKMGARVSNNSWGGSVSQVIDDALKVAHQRGMLFVASAGNSGRNNDGPQKHYPCVSTVGNVLCVAATDQNDRKADFSNYGATTVDLGAPGVDILSTTLIDCAPEFQDKCDPSGYKVLSGTSMAAPHVTGAAALVVNRHPSLTVDQLRKLLMETVDPVPALKGITVSGGRLNVQNALKGTADLSVALIASPNPATVGNSIALRIDVTNHGSSTATAVRLKVGLPQGVTFVSSSLGTAACSGASLIECALGTINNGNTVTVEMILKPQAEGETAYNVEVVASGVDPNLTNNGASAETTVRPPPAGGSPPPIGETPPPDEGPPPGGENTGGGGEVPPAQIEGGGSPPVPGDGEGGIEGGIPPASGGGGGCAMRIGGELDPILIGLFLLVVGEQLRRKMKKYRSKTIWKKVN
jgi:uncharacterized repeat protein (TIGR01451 family)